MRTYIEPLSLSRPLKSRPLRTTATQLARLFQEAVLPWMTTSTLARVAEERCCLSSRPGPHLTRSSALPSAHPRGAGDPALPAERPTPCPSKTPSFDLPPRPTPTIIPRHALGAAPRPTIQSLERPLASQRFPATNLASGLTPPREPRHPGGARDVLLFFVRPGGSQSPSPSLAWGMGEGPSGDNGFPPRDARSRRGEREGLRTSWEPVGGDKPELLQAGRGGGGLAGAG